MEFIQDHPATPALDETRVLLKRMVGRRAIGWFTPSEQALYDQLVLHESSLLAATH